MDYTNLIGATLDNRYQLVDKLGEGGMGVVYKGYHSGLDRDVAIKVMHPHYTRHLTFQERFLQEAQLLARLDHPNVVKVYDSGRDRGALLYLVMEFVPGDNLHQLLQKLWRNSQWILLPEAITLVKQLCLAVDYVHRQDILHRDIKPANIMLKLQGQETAYKPVLTDLGLAKLMQGGLATQEGKLMGTPPYMSPEQALGEPTDARSDVYSLGILLYELAVGRLPFPIKSLKDAIRYHTREQPPRPRTLHPDLPPLVEKAILKALKKDPAKRFPHAAAFAEALDYVEARVSTEIAPHTALEGAVSLMTEFQESLINVRGSSIEAEFPASINISGQSRIQILAPDKQARTVTIEGRQLTIGRSPRNDLVLDDPKVSGQHARIEYDGLNYKVTDLDSTNGTFLANIALTPGVPKIWTPGQVLRIGKSYLRLNQGQSEGHPSIIRTDGTMVDPSMIRTSSGAARVAVFMEPDPLSVEPGSSLTTTLTALNQGAVVDHFQIAVSGIPPNWLTLSTQSIELLPGDQGDVTLIIQPPRTAESRSGDYQLTIQVASQDAPTERVELTKPLTVEPFHQFNYELRPQRISAGKAAQLTLYNQGNGTETFTIKWQDRADEVAFDPMHTTWEFPPGTEESIPFRAKPRRRPWFGGRQNYPFTAQIITPWGDRQAVEGEIVSSGRLPVWLLTLFLFGCVALLGVGSFLFYVDLQYSARATQTAIAVKETETYLNLIADTDGDGIRDIDDPDPNRPPTATPRPTASPIPTATPNYNATAMFEDSIAATATSDQFYAIITDGNNFYEQGMSLLLDQQDYIGAITNFNDAIKEYEKLLDINHSQHSTVLTNLSNAYYHRGGTFVILAQNNQNQTYLDFAISDYEWLKSSGTEPGMTQILKMSIDLVEIE